MGIFSLLGSLLGRSRSASSGGESYVVRDGKPRRIDEAVEASQSGDIARMTKALAVDTHPVDRHFLIQTLVAAAYKRREEASMRALVRRVGSLHVQELARLKPVLKKEFGKLPRITGPVHLVTVLSEDGDLDQAVAVCQQVEQLGFHDGTAGGWEGRIAKIRKKAVRT